MDIVLWNYFKISKRFNTVRDKRYDLTSFFHCVTFSVKQEVDDVIQQGLFPRVMALLFF